jgi:hypothetical protein
MVQGPLMVQSGRIRLRKKLDELGSEGTAAFDPHSLESRHSAFGQNQPFRFAPIPAVKAGIWATRKQTWQK